MKTNEKKFTKHLEVQNKISSIKFKFLVNQKAVVYITMIQATYIITVFLCQTYYSGLERLTTFVSLVSIFAP